MGIRRLHGKNRILCLLLAMLFISTLLSGCKGREDFKEVYRRQGIQALDEGNYDAAVESFKAALGEGRGIIKPVDYDINYYLGYTYYLKGDYTEAVAIYDNLLTLKPKEIDAYYYRALAKLMLKDRTGAEEDFLKVTAADPRNYDTYIDIFFRMCEAGFTEDGKAYLQATLDDAKGMSDYDKGRICYYLGNYSDARVYLEKGKDMSDPDTILMLGKTYEAISDYSYAASLYNTYLSDKGNNASVYNQLGVCRMRMEDYAAALSAFESGLNLEDPEWQQDLMYNEAVAYEYMLDFETAREKMKEYLAKYPKDEDAAREYEFLLTR